MEIKLPVSVRNSDDMGGSREIGMLQIKDICKQYKTGDFIQKALDGVSLSFRDHEFVSILGPSGSGKTTLLNIIGGLDHYDSGDLVINGVSTRRYRDRDWDAYRNHAVGFVFQSYNLIMHQTVRSNVELALTISGIAGAERRRLAEEALRKVGLEKHMDKKPDQLSGGQMQRVAIARALVNNPDIILADEPTGALDSETSVQVMEILKEISGDHLVIMVTHNPELARQYASRTVTIRDGKILSDTDPFDPEIPEDGTQPPRKKAGRTGMSFLTALSLSLSNLRTKKARTLIVAIAGSIGIIGISLVLALSNGVNSYISAQETAALSQYPLEIDRTGFDMAGLMGNSSGTSGMADAQESGTDTEKDKGKDGGKGTIAVRSLMRGLLSKVNTNDLTSFKKWLDQDGTVRDESDAIEYLYDVTPRIYREKDGNPTQVSPVNLLEGLDLGNSQMSSMMGSAMNMDVFFMLPESRKILNDRYSLEAGNWPESADEIILVLSNDGRVNDSMLYALGMKDRNELSRLVKEKSEQKDNTGVMDSDGKTYTYDDFLGMQFQTVSKSSLYERDDESGIWIDRSDDTDFVRNALKDGITLTVSGIVRQKEDNSSAMRDSGFAYTQGLLTDLMKQASDSGIVKDQMNRTDINVLTGHTFAEDNDPNQLDLGILITVDQDAVKSMLSSAGLQAGTLNLDSSALADAFAGISPDSPDFSEGLDLSALQGKLPRIGADQLSGLLDGVIRSVPQEEMQRQFSSVLEHYMVYAASNPSTDYSGLQNAVLNYLSSPETAETVRDFLNRKITAQGEGLFTREDVVRMTAEVMGDFPGYLQHRLSQDADAQTDPGTMAQILQDYMQEASTQAKIDQVLTELSSRMQSLSLTRDDIRSLLEQLVSGYSSYAEANALPDPALFSQSFQEYLQSSRGREDLSQLMSSVIDTGRLQQNLGSLVSGGLQQVTEALTGQIQDMLKAGLQNAAGQIQDALQQQLGQAMSGMGDNFTALTDPDALRKMIKMNLAPDQMRSLLSGMLTGNGTSYEGNLTKFGYASMEDPSEIDIYPKNFQAKNKIKDRIASYNDDVKKAGQEEKAISYTDMISAMMSSVTNIVDTVGVVMIAFISISLVVSSIMIGVITYISVLERRKEIGILRAMGASKRNVANVFNAETFLTGLLSGSIGVLTALLLTIPVNRILPRFINGEDVKIFLAPKSAAMMILLSIGLTLLAGLIPSTQASRNDPVKSLRSE